MNKCPRCGSEERQNRAGLTTAKSQRYKCMKCGKKYTPEKKQKGYDLGMRKKAIQMYIDGTNLRRISRHLGLHHRTVSLWVQAYAKEIPNAPVPERVEVAEMDELFTFIGNKKKRIYIVTKVDRKTRCFIGCHVVWERKTDNMQKVVDQGPTAHQYYSDAFPTYGCLVYFPGQYQVSTGKTDTYSVEGDNAKLRHYLARLVRKSRCFSRCPYAFCYALRLFFFAFNSRQLHKQLHPKHPAHVFEFVAPRN